MKTKEAIKVRVGMEKILKTSDRFPKNLLTDAGREFFNKEFASLMKRYHINHYSTFSPIKASIAERVIRTLKEKLYIQFSLRGKYNWINILDDVTHKYNDTVHRTIRMKPRNVTKLKEKALLASVYNHPKIVTKQRYSIGDVVRISKYKSLFDKGYTPNWTTELFRVAKVQFTNPTTYLLNDINDRPILGSFYDLELQKAKHHDVYLVEKILRRKDAQVFVKWLGLPSNENSWVDKRNVL